MRNLIFSNAKGIYRYFQESKLISTSVLAFSNIQSSLYSNLIKNHKDIFRPCKDDTIPILVLNTILVRNKPVLQFTILVRNKPVLHFTSFIEPIQKHISDNLLKEKKNV